MARNETIKLDEGVWTQFTNSDATKVRLQVQSTFPIRIKATIGAVAPTDDSGSIELVPGPVMPATYTLEELFPGVVGANRLWGICHYDSATVSTSHA